MGNVSYIGDLGCCEDGAEGQGEAVERICVCVCLERHCSLSVLVSVCGGLYLLVWIRGSALLLAGPPSRNSSSCIHQIKMKDALLREWSGRRNPMFQDLLGSTAP